MIFRFIGLALAIVLMVLAAAACASKPPSVTTVIDCPQPTAEALAPAQPLPRVPALSADPGEAIGALSVVIASDDAAYADERARRETLIRHGVERCGWIR